MLDVEERFKAKKGLVAGEGIAFHESRGRRKDGKVDCTAISIDRSED